MPLASIDESLEMVLNSMNNNDGMYESMGGEKRRYSQR